MPNPNTALILRANYEDATAYLATYMQRIVDKAVSIGYNVIDLHAEDATKANFFNAIETNDPLIVIVGGHGNSTTFAAQNGEFVLQACQNDEVMSGREGIFNSCSVGIALGPSMHNKSALWFAGWRADYLFLYSDPMPANLAEDEYAKPFMECIIQPALTRLESRNTSRIYNDTINLFNTHLSRWWNSDDPVASDMITLLTHDRDNFMITGAYTPTAQGIIPFMLIGALAYLFVGG